MDSEVSRTRQAQALFEGVADRYDGPAQWFGLFRYRAWHRQIAKAVASADKPALVLDMCSGTGAIAQRIVGRVPGVVVCADATRGMLRQATRRTGLGKRRVHFVQSVAQAPPFLPGSFDVVVFSYLLRYVDDVPGTIAALGKLVRPGGRMVSLEFGVPEGKVARVAWRFYTGTVLPAGLRLLSPGWREVGSFLGPSIEAFERQWPAARLEAAWREAGFDVQPTRRLSLGGGRLMHGTRRA